MNHKQEQLLRENIPAARDSTLNNDAKLQWDMLVIDPPHHWPKLHFNATLLVYNSICTKEENNLTHMTEQNTVHAAYCTVGYSFLILDFTWIQGLPAVFIKLDTVTITSSKLVRVSSIVSIQFYPVNLHFILRFCLQVAIDTIHPRIKHKEI